MAWEAGGRRQHDKDGWERLMPPQLKKQPPRLWLCRFRRLQPPWHQIGAGWGALSQEQSSEAHS